MRVNIRNILLLVSLLLTGCGNNAKEEISKKEIVVLQPSEEAITYREEVLRPNEPYYLGKGYFEEMVNLLEASPYNYFPTESNGDAISLNCNVEKLDDINSYSLYTLTEKSNDYNSIILYIHGGAYLNPLLKAHVTFCDRLAETLHSKVYLPIYPLSTQATYDVAYDYMEKVYEMILAENKDVYIMGDSAGGGFSLGFTMYLKNNKKKLPKKMVLLSPWTDVNSKNIQGVEDFENNDLTLVCYGLDECGKMWAGSTDRKDYRISPIYGDLDNLPDMLIISGSDEITYPTTQKIYNQITNTNIKLIIAIGLWHVYPIYSIPEKEMSIDQIKAFINN